MRRNFAKAWNSKLWERCENGAQSDRISEGLKKVEMKMCKFSWKILTKIVDFFDENADFDESEVLKMQIFVVICSA